MNACFLKVYLTIQCTLSTLSFHRVNLIVLFFVDSLPPQGRRRNRPLGTLSAQRSHAGQCLFTESAGDARGDDCVGGCRCVFLRKKMIPYILLQRRFAFCILRAFFVRRLSLSSSLFRFILCSSLLIFVSALLYSLGVRLHIYHVYPGRHWSSAGDRGRPRSSGPRMHQTGGVHAGELERGTD